MYYPSDLMENIYIWDGVLNARVCMASSMAPPQSSLSRSPSYITHVVEVKSSDVEKGKRTQHCAILVELFLQRSE